MTTMDTKDVISTLNDLIETSKDGEAGFKACADDAQSVNLKNTFSARAQECGKAAAELQALVLQLGGDPEDSTSISGDMHRRWVDIKSAITGKDDQAVLNECERGEDVAKKSYKTALDKDLPPDIRAVVQRQYEGVLRNHDEVKALRDSHRS